MHWDLCPGSVSEKIQESYYIIHRIVLVEVQLESMIMSKQRVKQVGGGKGRDGRQSAVASSTVAQPNLKVP